MLIDVYILVNISKAHHRGVTRDFDTVAKCKLVQPNPVAGPSRYGRLAAPSKGGPHISKSNTSPPSFEWGGGLLLVKFTWGTTWDLTATGQITEGCEHVC